MISIRVVLGAKLCHWWWWMLNMNGSQSHGVYTMSFKLIWLNSYLIASNSSSSLHNSTTTNHLIVFYSPFVHYIPFTWYVSIFRILWCCPTEIKIPLSPTSEIYVNYIVFIVFRFKSNCLCLWHVTTISPEWLIYSKIEYPLDVYLSQQCTAINRILYVIWSGEMDATDQPLYSHWSASQQITSSINIIFTLSLHLCVDSFIVQSKLILELSLRVCLP